MKYSNFTILERKVMRRSSALIAPSLVFAAALMISGQSFADETHYRVVFEDVPGYEEIEGGKVLAGIKILEDQLDQVEQMNSGDIWSTLCGAYLVEKSVYQADRACNKAVEVDPTNHALNNRGVVRLFKGDLSGARNDFGRVRTPDVEAYLEELKEKDVRLVAASNFELVNQLLEKYPDTEFKPLNVIRTAAIEDIID